MAAGERRAAAWRHTWGRLARVWATLQVERQGKYSVERLYQLREYERSTSNIHAWMVVLATPLPCLVAITILDSVSLKPPSLGLAHSHLFWLRAYLMVFIVVAATMVQLRQIIPRLPVRRRHIVSVAAASAAFGVAGGIGLAMRIGFPLPFTVVLGAPGACTAFAAVLFLTWGKLLRAQPDLIGELLSFVGLTVKQITMTAVYPLFSYVFNTLESYEQTAFALVLPVLKLAFKNWIHASVRRVEDLKPEMIILNAEVFHALYVAYSMQTATSHSTIAVLVVVDFVQADEERRVVATLGRSERRAKVERTLQLLHMTEFAALVEYTEVIIPVVYCLYLLTMSHLPNRAYYTQLRDLESDQLARNIANILLYASLELVSFLALSWHLRRRLEIPLIHQLAFVLESQWHLVQSKLILWVVFAAQMSLEHFGVDYSFQFTWLHHDSRLRD